MKTKKRTTKSTLPLQQLSNERGIRAGASSGKTRGKNRSILRESRCKAGRSPSLTADDRSIEWNSLNVNLTLSDTTVWAILVGALQDPISRRRALPTRSSWMRIPKMMMMIKRSRLVTLATTSRKKVTGGGSLCIPLTHLDLSLQVALNTNQRRKDHQKTKGRSVAEKEEGMSVVVAETMIVMKMIKGRRKEEKPRPSMLDEVPSETTTQPPWKSHNGASQTNHCHARARVLRTLMEQDIINTSGASI